jgi:diguanylate cyclase (GGDEF)-like protein
VNPTPDPNDPSVAHAEGELARLGVQVEAMRALLVRLTQDVVRAEARLDQTQAAALVEANEELILAALANQADAEGAAQALQDAVQSAELDALTQLTNRTTLLDRFAQALANARRHGAQLALLFLDLDNFKQVNDAHGHAFGDRVLRLAADRLVSAVRRVDTVSRHGGDEFLVLLAELTEPDDAQTVAEKLIEALGAPAELDGHVVSLTASVGIAIFPDDGDDFDTLIARADAAMYRTKRQRAGGVAFHGKAPVAGPGLDARPDADLNQPAPTGAGAAADPERQLVDLREANEHLVLAALTARELHTAAEQARQRHTAFLAAVADELRNPMAPIRIVSAMLGGLPTDEWLLPRVEGIVEQQLTQMSRLVGDLVDASAVDTGGLALDRHPVDMAKVIDAAVAACRPAMDERRQRFESHRPPGAIEMQGDAVRLQQIVSNLLDNASKHTHDGGRISLSVVLTTDSLVLTVADDGIGITPQMLPYVFEPFVQDAHALGFRGVGLGIGLTVVRALVRAHDGDLVAHSAGAGRGSQFVVTLPLAASGPIAQAAASASGDADVGQ